MIPDFNDDYYRDPLNKAANDIYSLFLIGALIGWFTIPFGSVAALFYYRQTPRGHLFRSHFLFQSMSTVWLVLSLGLWAGAAYYFWLSPTATINQMHGKLANSYRVEIAAAVILTFIFLYISWFRRIWRANRLLSDKQPIRNPLTAWLPR